MANNIVDLKDKTADNLSISGGKGANLSRLHGIPGIPVPNGFVVTAQGYSDLILSMPEVKKLLSRLRSITADQAEVISQLSKQIREEIERFSFPVEFTEEIIEALSEHGDSFPYAVRSSATAEDLPGASFAGQQDTFLNVIGLNNICEAIVKCWASLFNERAVAYRIKNGFPHDKVTIAVVVQKMVNSEVSGVLFTADPMTSDRFTTVIEAVRGLGEELVSGRKNPFEWKLRDGKLQKTSDGEGETPLTETHLLELAEIGKRIETVFGCEQDIEWCYTKEGFSIVQARPITTLYPLPPSPDGYKHCAISVGHLQMMTDTVLPLGISMLQKSNLFSVMELGGRMFMDITYDIAKFGGRMRVLSEARIKDPLMHEALKKIFDRKEYLRGIPDGPKGLTTVVDRWGVLAGALKTYRRNDEADIDAYVGRQNAEIEAVRGKLEKLSGADAIQFIIDEQEHFRKVLYDPAGAGTTIMTMLVGNAINKAIEKLTGEKVITNRLAKSVRHNVTSEMGLRLCEVSDVARNHPQVIAYLEQAGETLFLDELRQVEGGASVAEKLEKFLSEYGMRCTGEVDITRDRFRECPGLLSTALINNIKNLPAGHAITVFMQGKKEMEQLITELVSKMETAHGCRKAQKLKRRIEIYRKFIGVREYTKYFWICHYDVYKQSIMREVHKLVEAGALKESEDAYYLSMDELLDAVKSGYVNQDLIEERKNAYRSYPALTPPRIIFSDGEVPPVSYSANIPSGALAGLAVSTGIVEGRARVVENLENAHIEKGDILVTTFTDPSWTPIFVTLSGLVTEAGGMMSHGAVITREYGLPAVVGVVNATKLIKDGQRIRVNGTEGYIELLS
ncbi:MAG TPA: phosphoenolpyruvate synthase [Anaerovoracaceae bacterium]|nr:phosphoenolpyruvate synthase [Anaerovoracaceae bacterium]HYE68343.1 phosphoenolpyruvate synthase [Anaerovoracaceae bacterium]